MDKKQWVPWVKWGAIGVFGLAALVFVVDDFGRGVGMLRFKARIGAAALRRLVLGLLTGWAGTVLGYVALTQPPETAPGTMVLGQRRIRVRGADGDRLFAQDRTGIAVLRRCRRIVVAAQDDVRMVARDRLPADVGVDQRAIDVYDFALGKACLDAG